VVVASEVGYVEWESWVVDLLEAYFSVYSRHCLRVDVNKYPNAESRRCLS
jgi:hypothetical protein